MGFHQSINEHWRGWAAIIYLIICLYDFVIASSFFNTGVVGYVEEMSKINIELAAEVIKQTSRWEPLTLTNGGIFHLAFGAILGVSAWNKRELPNGK